jgi:hypothetical protein
MEVRLPDWWDYPAQCEHGHPWGPERVIVSWMHCRCPAAVEAVADAGRLVTRLCHAELRAAGRGGTGRGTSPEGKAGNVKRY